MTSAELFGWLRQFWRVALIGILGGILAFGGSFLLSTKYESSTQLLVRGRDTTFLTTTGEGLSHQPGVIDATLATALGQTQSALLNSRTVAEMVVEDLGLDQPRPLNQSIFAKTKRFFKGAYVRTKAYLMYGFYAVPDPYEAAVGEVYEGLSAQPRKDSYVVELTATAGSPELAAAIADSAADALVAVSLDRFRQDAHNYRDFLASQVERAAAEETTAAEALRAYKDEHGIANVNLEIELDTRAAEQLRLDLQSTEVDLQASQAELAVIQQSLREVASTASSSSRINTGRSTTEINATGRSTAYEELLVERERLEAQVASLEARRGALEEALRPGVDPTLTAEETQLRQLELQYGVASDTYRDLNTRYQQAVINAENDRFELTRVDEASVPLFPSKPKRYLFLGMGGIVGGLVGLVLTYMAVSGRGGTLLPTFGPQRTYLGRYEMYSEGLPDEGGA